MCGIVGILGNHEAAPILVEALKRLEYRGYDSAGIATVNSGRLDRRRGLDVHLLSAAAGASPGQGDGLRADDEVDWADGCPTGRSGLCVPGWI